MKRAPGANNTFICVKPLLSGALQFSAALDAHSVSFANYALLSANHIRAVLFYP